MKKITLLIILALFIATPCYSADYWVYVRLEDESGVTSEDDTGRSKRGDVIDVVKADGTNIPSKIAKDEWLIYKASLTDIEIKKLKETWYDDKYEDKSVTIAYRKNKLDLTALGVSIKRGLVSTRLDNKTFTTEKTTTDLISYEISRYIYLAMRPFNKLYSDITNYLVKPAYAFATTTCGDDATEDREQICTTNKTGEDYATIILWEDAKNSDLTVDKQIRTLEVYDDDGDVATTVVTIDGSTASADYYMKITSPADERHNGTNDDSATVVFTLSGAYGSGFSSVDQYVVIEWLIIEADITDREQSLIQVSTNSNTYNKFRNNIIVQTNSTASNQPMGIKQNSNYSPATVISNNIIYGFKTSSGSKGKGIMAQYDVTVYNNTTYDNDYGIWFNDSNTDADSTATNNIAIGSGTADFYFDALNVHDYNASSDATATGGNSLNSGTGSVPSTSDFVSITGGSEDFHLASAAVEIDLGSDLGSVANIDIDGRDRDAEGDVWDIGADEYVISGGAGYTFGNITFSNVTIQ